MRPLYISFVILHTKKQGPVKMTLPPVAHLRALLVVLPRASLVATGDSRVATKGLE
jgi:hypothetical protein